MQGLGQSNENHDFNAYNIANEIWSIVAVAFVTKVAANFADYRIPAIKASDANDANINEVFHATAPAGTVHYELRIRGATLADSYVVWVEKGPREIWTLIDDSASLLTIDRN